MKKTNKQMKREMNVKEHIKYNINEKKHEWLCFTAETIIRIVQG